MKKCSIIIRTKNEEKWINPCFSAIYDQTYKNFEIILVDNKSTDRTIEKAQKFQIKKVISIDDYLPGDALNKGIEYSSGDYIVCLSAHCIPVNNKWLENLVSALEESPNYAGVYGRQEPMSFSKASDKRDLLTVFGLDRKIQKLDSFFHNANSIIHRKLWEKNKFDNFATNIEDRLWAKKMLSLGFEFLYEPKASVYHYHGIHQDGNQTRLNGVLKIIEDMDETSYKYGELNISQLEIIAIIPISRLRKNNNFDFKINGHNQYLYTIKSALDSKYINRVFVSTDDKEVMADSISNGAECPFLRPKELSESYMSTEEVQKYSLEKLEDSGILPDLVVHLEETFPIRESGLVDKMIEEILRYGNDSVVAAKKESGFIWSKDLDSDYQLIYDGSIPREVSEPPIVGIKGLCCVTHPSFIRNGNMLGENIGLHVVNSLAQTIEVRDISSAKVASKILQEDV